MTLEKQRILIVEDEALIALNIQQILEAEGFETAIDCFTVAQAQGLIKEWMPHLVIIDIHLRGNATGIELAKELLKQDTIPYLFLTSFSDRLTLENVKSTRPYGYLVKPFKPEDLVSNVFLILNNFRHRNVDIQRKEEVFPGQVPYRIKKVLGYINDHLHEKIEISQLSALTQWENEHFGRVFKEYIHLTPYQYILQRKIEMARGLLTDHTLSLQEIAIKVGFDSYSNFFKAFKKYTGMAPEKYRDAVFQS